MERTERYSEMVSGEVKNKALVITINYKSTVPTLKFVESLQRTKAFSEIGIIIVDNSPVERDSSRIHIAVTQFANVELLESPTNRGYFGAARFAFDHYLARAHNLPDWVIVCNHDVVIEDGDFFLKLFAFDPGSMGIIAPRIQTLPGKVDQNPFMQNRPGWLRWTTLRLIFSSYRVAAVWQWLAGRKRAVRSLMVARLRSLSLNRAGRRARIYAPHGAFFIFSRKYFEAGGYLDGNLFLYGEEISVAEICRSLRLPVVYEPSLAVLHEEHASTGIHISRFSYECQKNALQYVTSHYLSVSGSPVESQTEP